MELPDPLTPPDCDLQDFKFMPLDVGRLRDSDLASDETPEACWAAVLLWCASWHQIPAASIPDNDNWQAKHAGYAQRGKISKEWDGVRDGALRGWIRCSDGRLYHPVIAEKAIDAWNSKLDQRWRTECSRIKKHADRHDMELPRPTFEAWVSAGCPAGHRLPVPEDNGQVSPGTKKNVPRETHSKGQGERQGQGQIEIPSGAKAPGAESPLTARDQVFAIGVTLLTAEGVAEKNARSFLAMQCKTHGEVKVVEALQRCAEEKPVQAIPWLQAVLKAAAIGSSVKPDDRKTRQLSTAAILTGGAMQQAKPQTQQEAIDVESKLLTS